MDYLIILLRPFVEYTSLIGNSRDATINYTWNVYNALFDHLDVVGDQFRCKDPEKTSWISEFITAIDTGIVNRLTGPDRGTGTGPDRTDL